MSDDDATSSIGSAPTGLAHCPTWVQVLQGVQCGALLVASLSLPLFLYIGGKAAIPSFLWILGYIAVRSLLSMWASAANRAAVSCEDAAVPSRAVILVLILGDLAVTGFVLLQWWENLADTGFSKDAMLVRVVPFVALGIALTSRLLRHRADPLRTHELRFVDTRSWLRSRLWPWIARRGLVAAAAVTVAALVLAPLALREALNPLTVHLAEDLPAPAAQGAPESVAGEVVWTHEVAWSSYGDSFELRDTLPGIAGPVLIQGSTITCLNTEDGTTRWAVERTGSFIIDARISPDGKSLVVVYRGTVPQGGSTHESERNVVVLDAASGREVTRRVIPVSHDPGRRAIQVTDQVVLIGGQAVSLKDGSTLWTLSDQSMESLRSWSTGSTSTLVTGRECDLVEDTEAVGASRYRDLCDLTLVDDRDPSRSRTVTNVVTDVQGNDIVFARGWTVRVADGAAESELTTADLEAVNIDDGSTWPIGDSAGPFLERIDDPGPQGTASMLLLGPPVRTAQQESGQDGEESAPIADRMIDPATGTITRLIGEVSWASLRDMGYPTAELETAALSWEEPTITITRTGGREPITLDLPVAAPGYGHALLQAVPGGVLLVVTMPLEENRAVICMLR